MGALKNAVKRKTHKERSQPLARRKHGLLEKKKDYKERARDFHRKEDTIKALKRKAEERNPDEFYFSMESAQTNDGVHVRESAQANRYSQDELRLMKTQDVKYIALKAQVEAKKVEKLRAALHFPSGGTARLAARRVIFVDSEAEARGYEREASQSGQGDKTGEGGADVRGSTVRDSRKARRAAAAAYRELEERAERQRKLAALAAKLAYDKALMGKGHRVKLRGGSAEADTRVFKWRKERKK